MIRRASHEIQVQRDVRLQRQLLRKPFKDLYAVALSDQLPAYGPVDIYSEVLLLLKIASTGRHDICWGRACAMLAPARANMQDYIYTLWEKTGWLTHMHDRFRVRDSITNWLRAHCFPVPRSWIVKMPSRRWVPLARMCLRQVVADIRPSFPTLAMLMLRSVRIPVSR